MADGRFCTSAPGGHPQCTTCGTVIFRKSEHVHVFRRNPYREECLCGECFAVCAAAAVPVFRAAEALGIEPDLASVHQALDQGRIVVLAQMPFGFNVPMN